MKKNGHGGKGNNGKKNKKSALPNLTPPQIAVIVGILTNALKVESVLIDKDQTIQVLLEGSIRRKSKADIIADQLDNISVGDLIEAFIRR